MRALIFTIPLLFAISCSITEDEEASNLVHHLEGEVWVEIEAPLSGYRCFVLAYGDQGHTLCAPADRAIVKSDANVLTLDEQEALKAAPE